MVSPTAELALDDGLEESTATTPSQVQQLVAKAGFTHELDGPLTTGRAGRSPIEAIGGERHDRKLGGVLCRAR
jgi:hypothetical protein